MTDIARSMRRFDPGTPCTECGKPTYCTRSGARCVEHWVTPEVDVTKHVVPNAGLARTITPPLTAAERDAVRAANYPTNPRSAVLQGGAW